MRVKEYWLYDPLGEYLRPRLRGYRLVGGKAVTVVREAVGAEQDQQATKADLDVAIAGLETRLRTDLATTTDLQALEGRMRAEPGTVRWTIGLLAAFVCTIGLRVFGLL